MTRTTLRYSGQLDWIDYCRCCNSELLVYQILDTATTLVGYITYSTKFIQLTDARHEDYSPAFPITHASATPHFIIGSSPRHQINGCNPARNISSYCIKRFMDHIFDLNILKNFRPSSYYFKDNKVRFLQFRTGISYTSTIQRSLQEVLGRTNRLLSFIQ
jgi:hypothetical protein